MITFIRRMADRVCKGCGGYASDGNLCHQCKTGK